MPPEPAPEPTVDQTAPYTPAERLAIALGTVPSWEPAEAVPESDSGEVTGS